MGDEGGWRAELDRWLEPFLAELNHAARRTMCPKYVAGLIGLGECGFRLKPATDSEMKPATLIRQ